MGTYFYNSICLQHLILMVLMFQGAFGCGGLRYETSCVNIQITQVETYTDYKTWNQANEDCNTKGYQLVSIHSLEKLEAITEYIQYASEQKFYIGLSRAADTPRAVIGNWKWSSTLPLTFNKWVPGDPNVRDSICAGTYLDRNQFVDVGCGDISGLIGLTYIYEYPIPIDYCENISCHNGTCQSANGNCSCTCDIGFEGEFCDVEINYCENINCNNGTCHLANGNFSCTCDIGFEGEFCEIEINYCENIDCNNGICHSANGNFSCTCDIGFEGEFCDIEINYCENIDCNDGTCHSANGNFSCTCNIGFEGEFCDIEINYCENINCNNGTCHSANGSFSCTCDIGFEGEFCDIEINYCENIDCINGTCHSANGNFSCTCDIGFEGEFCDIEINYCENIDCNNGTCHSANGNFSCTCDIGFEGEFCDIEINYCENIDCNNGTCHSSNGNFFCTCDIGFEGEFCEIEINYCENINCNNGTCHSANGNFSCTCDIGFEGEFCEIVSNNPCQNINCNNGTCYATNGIYSCQCYAGFEGEFCEINQCLAEDVEKMGTIYSFPNTSPGATAFSYQVCPVYSPRPGLPIANRSCLHYNSVANWGEVFVFECGTDNTTDKILQLSQVEVTEDNIEEVANTLEVLTRNASSNVDGAENATIYSSQVLKNIVSINSSSPSVTTTVINSVNNLLDIVGDVEDSEEIRRASSSTIQSMEEQLATVASADFNITVNRKNVDVTVRQLDVDDVASNGLVYISFQNTSEKPSLLFSESRTNFVDVDTLLELPSEVFTSGPTVINGGKVSAIFIIYHQTTLFRTNYENKQIGSKVISAKINKKKTRDLVEPVVGVFTQTMNGTNAECVFWDFQLANGYGNWSNAGCVYNTTKDRRVICHCDHLTNFAVLTDYHGQIGLSQETRYHVLSIISLVGCIVSVLALVLTIIIQTYSMHTMPRSREQHTIRPKLVLINLSIALCLLYLVFAVGIEQTKNKHTCIVISVVLHYFTISSMAWMTVQAVNIYLSLVKVFPTYISKFRMKAYTFGWGFPLIPVTMSLILDVNSYTNKHYCFLKPGAVLYYGNISVVGVLFLTNIVIFILVIRVLMCCSRQRIQRITEPKSKFKHVKDQLSTAIGLSILLGLTWIFGFGAIERSSSSHLTFSMQLLFCIFNSLQGWFIFVFYAVRTGDFKTCMCSFIHISKPPLDSISHSKGRRLGATTDERIYMTNTTKGLLKIETDYNWSSI
ncbi:adhesion G protein-coupled receptor E1-like [Anneissia japonica]|uniref:adhesion G protein-coupled receptor E1-like n=1 Tax=Anneissia japonica TaxID=1529436 RepID=UPI001425A7B3|nr:adhesion G protein-coupled receptor E1-like [Anneissia japonica]